MSRMSRFQKCWLPLLAALLLSILATPCWAGGGQHYPNGAEDLMVGALPPPGIYLKNYLAYIQKDELLGDDGNTFGVDLEADVLAVVPRLIWVTPMQLAGASVAMHAFFPLYSADVTVKAGGATLADSDEKGLGDIIFSPFVLGWHFGPSFHMVATVDTYAPTGNYDKDEAATQLLSRNHWTFEPVLALSYFAGPVDLSLKLMYDIHTKNDENDPDGAGPAPTTELKPGQEFHFDWAVGYSFLNSFTLGATGFCHWQTTDDEVDGTEIHNDRSRLLGAGPVLKWWPNKGRFSATAKHVTEFQGKNIAQGSTTWLNIIWAF